MLCLQNRNRRLITAFLCLLLMFGVAVSPAIADDPPSAVGPIIGLLKSGRLPPERLGAVVELVCQRGNEHDLAYIFGQATADDGFRADVRLKALQCLAEAGGNRKIKPAGDLSRLEALVQHEGEHAREIRLAAVRLAGLWKVESLAGGLRDVALDRQAAFGLRMAAVDALVSLEGEAAAKTLEKLATGDESQRLRYLAVAASVALDLDQAAGLAARVLSQGTADDDLSPMLAAFLNRQGGSDKLAEAVTQTKIDVDVAKLALRYMYSVGRNDANLSSALSGAAGITAETENYTKEEVAQIVKDVTTKGDPARGEEIFRRADLSCMKCHAVSKAGGDIGPDLSAIGASSPPEYLVRSILFPSEAIKEQYETAVILTIEGRVFTGIVADRDGNRIVLKTADGAERVIPVADIEEEAKGDSLMPQGLTKFLTRDELVHLSRFLAELGKPGDYAIRPVPSIQRWRVLSRVPPEASAAVPDSFLFAEKVLKASESLWQPAYAKVSGKLPLEELVAQVGSPVLFVQGELNVTSAGEVGLRLNSADGLHVWIGEREFPSTTEITADLEEGRHKVTLRVDTAAAAPELQVDLMRIPGSPAVAEVVGGP
jgi:putative heme-binding domain-containing protein